MFPSQQRIFGHDINVLVVIITFCSPESLSTFYLIKKLHINHTSCTYAVSNPVTVETEQSLVSTCLNSDKLHVNLGLCNISRVTLEICRTHPLSWNADIKTPDLETCELVDHTVGICSIYNGWWSVLWLNRPGLPLLCVPLHCLMPLLQTNNVHVYSRSKVYKVCDFISWMGG